MSSYIAPKIHWITQEQFLTIFAVAAKISECVTDALTKYAELEPTHTFTSAKEAAQTAASEICLTLANQLSNQRSRFYTSGPNFEWEMLNIYTSQPMIRV